MVIYDTTVKSRRSPEETFDYLAAFSNAQEWDPGVATGEALQEGPARLGAGYRLGIPLGPRTASFDYRVLEIDRPRRVVLRADHRLVRSTDTITVEPAADGSVVHYEAVLEPKGAFRLIGPLVARRFRVMGDRAAEGLQSVLG